MSSGKADEIRVRRAALPSRSEAFVEAMRKNKNLMIRNRKKVIVSTLLIAVTVFCLLAIPPPAAEAATGMVTIDLGALGGANANNSADAATDSQWSYDDTTKILALSTYRGNYTLHGTNADLRVIDTTAENNITMNGVNITSAIDDPCYLGDLATLTLVGNNTITGIGKRALVMGGSCTINGTGTLTATSTTLFGLRSFNTFTIGGTATVNAISSADYGIFSAGSPVINIGAGAKLIATGTAGGVDFTGLITINCDGMATFTGTSGPGFYFNYKSNLLGSGKITMVGHGYDAIGFGGGNRVWVGDQVTLEIKNNGAGETHNFEKASTANTHQWKLTNATLISGNLTDVAIVVTVAAGETGTIQRIPIPPLATDVTFTAVQTGGTSGTADSTGIKLTFSTAVTGLAASDISVTNDTGAVTVGSLSGSGNTRTIALTAVTAQGNVRVSVSNFGTFNVTTATQTVAVYKNTAVPPTDVTFTAVQTGGTSGTVSSTGIVLTFSLPVAGLTTSNVTITNGTGSATKGLVTGSGTTWTVVLLSVTTQGNVTVAVSNFGSFNVTGGAKTVMVYASSSAPIVYDIKDGADGNWVKGSNNGHAITVGAPSSKVTGVNVDDNPVDAGDYTVTNNASGDAIVTLKAAYLETLDIGSYSLKVFMNDGSASTTMTVSPAEDAEEGGGGSSTMPTVAVAFVAVLVLGVLAYMFAKRSKMK